MTASPRALIILAFLLAAFSFARAQSPAPSATPDLSGTAAVQPSPTPPDFSQFKTADALWAQIQKLEEGPGSPDASPDQVLDILHQLTAASAEFQSRYPTDTRRWEARLIALQYSTMLQSSQGQQPDPDKIEAELKAVAAAKDAPVEAREEARINLIGMHASGLDILTAAVESEMLAFIHDFPDDPDDAQLQKSRLDSLRKTDIPAGEKLLAALLKDKNPAVADMAKSEVQMRDLMKKPLDLQFTGEDGAKVDLAKLRGKIVMIDFWATWCAPCMEEVPTVVSVFKEFHSQGFEIIGISLDQDKGPLEGVTKAQGMTWPQYFDGKGWQNAISSRFGISQIPTAWLINKKGMVVDTEAADGLEEKVKALLAK